MNYQKPKPYQIPIMHIAYSALRGTDGLKHESADSNQIPELQLRYRAYLETCNKYSNHINVIQKYLPGWLPKFR
ncbi:MAG: hypothetical protein ACHQHN_15105 [Sphingobacteriales bacterium]